jgi:exonuclease SbcD
LGVPGFIVGDRLETHHLQTGKGPIQVITLPWLTRSTLLTRPDAEGLSMGEVNQMLGDRLRVALEGEIRQLNPQIPTVLLAHAMVDTACYGAERFLAVGKGFTVPLSLLSRPCFDYVALGHVHRHQVLGEQPPVVYPGSIERVDFSEEKEEKGFVLVQLEQGNTTFEFCPLPVRAFRTIEVDVSGVEVPQEHLLQALPSDLIQDAVVRLVYRLRTDQMDQIDSAALHQALSPAHSYTIHPELISQLSRPRLPELQVGNHREPLEVLKTYLSSREDLQDLQAEIIQAAQALLGEEAGWLDEIEPGEAIAPAAEAPDTTPETQLKLL